MAQFRRSGNTFIVTRRRESTITEKFFMADLKETFIDELRDLLDAEKQLLKALPKLAKAAESEELRAAFETHAEETGEQISRLEQVFEIFEMEPRGKKCAGMQ